MKWDRPVPVIAVVLSPQLSSWGMTCTSILSSPIILSSASDIVPGVLMVTERSSMLRSIPLRWPPWSELVPRLRALWWCRWWWLPWLRRDLSDLSLLPERTDSAPSIINVKPVSERSNNYVYWYFCLSHTYFDKWFSYNSVVHFFSIQNAWHTASTVHTIIL